MGNIPKKLTGANIKKETKELIWYLRTLIGSDLKLPHN